MFWYSACYCMQKYGYWQDVENVAGDYYAVIDIGDSAIAN